MTDKGQKPAGEATTDAQGRYVIRDALLNVRSWWSADKANSSTSFARKPAQN